jgi:dCTP deaminase
MIGATKYVPIIDGRSTTGRYGLALHITAGVGDTHFFGVWTLELEARHRDTLVRPGDVIGQVSFETIEGELQPYTGSYANRSGPVGPKPLK